MEKKKLTFVPDGSDIYAGFIGDELVALVVPCYPFGVSGTPAWQWCARTQFGWAFPSAERAQCEGELERAMHRAAQHISLYSGDCLSVSVLPPEEVDS